MYKYIDDGNSIQWVNIYWLIDSFAYNKAKEVQHYTPR
jgi:hypothetical protein